uniref:Uncharacterized protein n=1 Tax=Schistosoma japonicum TaxID=6182 RepID=Q5C1J0_SCHJA|nr:unknown [Schistosoma japonicum]
MIMKIFLCHYTIWFSRNMNIRLCQETSEVAGCLKKLCRIFL